jgi:lipopolysaccharide assembly outer membrane protein LptD (OstA)
MLAETENKVINRDILYGLGYRLNENWSVSFEHIYNLEDDRLRRQTYEIRRNLHCWDIDSVGQNAKWNRYKCRI